MIVGYKNESEGSKNKKRGDREVVKISERVLLLK